ncbi:hypothetical protein MGA5115_03112 [Marinomonas gallaica]|uniref:Uncharacterized protein n=1 Tax=Marinomonas gallaica TaxID=1806667 RepID=A0A1C3JUM8_9GAMM|nr:hypothetical protein [Marinomonas gallaica]SBT18951.1 hypothetical protein MGA5115_03112 [Marinomonas gallaica]SBT21906.1 hypothetical protein MGA5116_02516 [Marinomonas gallaica]
MLEAHNLIGSIDEFINNELKGWVAEVGSDEKLDIELYCNKSKVWSGKANCHRKDLLLSGIGQGDNAFNIKVSNDYLLKDNEFEIKLKGESETILSKCISVESEISNLNSVDNFEVIRSVVSSAFDSDFYLMQVPNILLEGIDPVEHYIKFGWKLGLDPNPAFNTSSYLEDNELSGENIEPFYHWLNKGREAGISASLSLYPAKELTRSEKVVMPYFDFKYYLETYPDVKLSKQNPLVHYMRNGWKEGRNPNSHFNTVCYMLNNLDVILNQCNPFLYYVEHDNNKYLSYSETDVVKRLLKDKIFHAMQDITFPNELAKAEKVFVMVVPEHNEMSGGIYSMFSIANIVKRLKPQFGYEVLIVTKPNTQDVTYCRQKNFRNSEDVYRFNQITRLRNAKEIYLNIPEYATKNFTEILTNEEMSFLKSVEVLNVNILNQNTELMPDKHSFQDLREISNNLTQSVAHHSYFGQYYSDLYDLPTLLLPAYTDLSGYNAVQHHEKDDLIIYSLDDAPHKESVLNRIREKLPDFELIEIRGITFDQYMELANRCKYSISFGEGFDGYVAQPIYQGGIGITVYNEEFFPSEDFIKYPNFFESGVEMLDGIVDFIEYFESNVDRYFSLNKELIVEYDKLYSFDNYLEKIKGLLSFNFDLYPGSIDDSKMGVASYKLGLSSGNI